MLFMNNILRNTFGVPVKKVPQVLQKIICRKLPEKAMSFQLVIERKPNVFMRFSVYFAIENSFPVSNYTEVVREFKRA